MDSNELRIGRYHPVKLIGLNERAKKIIKYYDNKLLLKEYDELGRSLNIYNGKCAIFCVSPEGYWNGWFILDEDVRLQLETEGMIETFKRMGILNKNDDK